MIQENENNDDNNDQPEVKPKEKVTIEFPYSYIIRAKAPKAFDVAEKVATDWKNEGDFTDLGIGHPVVDIVASQTLQKAKEVENKPPVRKTNIQIDIKEGYIQENEDSASTDKQFFSSDGTILILNSIILLILLDKLFESSQEYIEDINEYKKNVMSKIGLNKDSFKKNYDDEFSTNFNFIFHIILINKLM